MKQFLELTQKDGQKTIINSLHIVYVKCEHGDVIIGLNHPSHTSVIVKESLNEIRSMLELPFVENDTDIKEMQGRRPPFITIV